MESSKSDMDLEEETPVVETKPFVETSNKSGNSKLKVINLKRRLYKKEILQLFYKLIFVISFRSCGKRRATSEGM